MTSRETFKIHAALLDSMAATVGADLEAAVLSGQLRADTLVDAVIRCTGCGNPGHCAQWLEEQAGAAPEPVGYCRNIGLLDALAAPRP